MSRVSAYDCRASAWPPPVQRVLNELDRDLPVFNVRTTEQHLRDSVFAFLPLLMAVTMATAQGVMGLLPPSSACTRSCSTP